MKVCIEKSITILAVAYLLAATTMGFSEGSKWMFNSMHGQALWVSHKSKDSVYALTFWDVTENVKSCGSMSIKICFRSRFVDIAIPEKKPKVGQSWHIAGTTFSLVSVIENLELLDESFGKVLVIAVERNMEFPSGRLGTRKFRLLFPQ